MFCILTGKEVLSGCYALDACHYCTSLPQSLGGCVDSLQKKRRYKQVVYTRNADMISFSQYIIFIS